MEETTAAGHGPDLFALLPDEIIVFILSFLPGIGQKLLLERVCHRFYSISLMGDLWKVIDFSRTNKMDDAAFGRFLCRLSRCEHLSLTRCKSLTDTSLSAIASYCPNLVSLNLTNCRKMTEEGLIGLLSQGECKRKLRVLDLSNTNFKKTRFGEDVVPLLSGLTALRFNNPPCSRTSAGAFVAAIATHCTNLTELRLMATSQIFDDHLLPIQNMTQLTELSLRSIYRLTDKPLKVIAPKCNQIRTLCLSHCDRVTDEGVIAIATNLGVNLETLIIKSLKHVGDASMKALGENCPSLTVLDITQTAVTDAGVTSIASGCNKLIQLDLRGLGISDTALQSLGMGCPELRNLDLTSCTQVTDVGITAIASGCRLIERLDLQDLVSISDEGMKALVMNCTNLQRLDLSATKITDKTIQYLEQYSMYLFKLNILRCEDVTDECVRGFIHRHPIPELYHPITNHAYPI